MARPTIYVAGPVARPGTEDDWNVNLADLYTEIERQASRAHVRVYPPYLDLALNPLGPVQFATAIAAQIAVADAMLVLLLDPRRPNLANYSVAVEAQRAAQAGKAIAIVAETPERVPRLLRALTGGRPAEKLSTVDFAQLLGALAESAEGSATA